MVCEDCGEEGSNHAADCPTWGEGPDDGTGRELAYDSSLDPISPFFDPRSWDR